MLNMLAKCCGFGRLRRESDYLQMYVKSYLSLKNLYGETMEKAFVMHVTGSFVSLHTHRCQGILILSYIIMLF